MTLSDKEIQPPIGFYRTTGEWVAYHLARGKPMDGHFMELYSDHDSQYLMPKGLEASIPWEFRQQPCRTHPSPFVAVIPDGRIWGRKGAVITPDNKLLWDVSLEHTEKTPEQHTVFEQAGLPPLEYHAETLAVLTYTASDSYFHWMLDVLPRIDLLRKSGIAIDRFVFNTNPSPAYQHETLDMLGIPAEKRVEIVGNAHIQAKRLVVPSLIGYTSNYPKWAVDFIRKELSMHSRKHEPNQAEKIYMSRDDANHRKVTNEEKVMGLLDKYGYIKLNPGQLSVAEQISIFTSARCIIAPHGANLTNLIFCQPGTKVMEIFSPGYVNPIYWVLSNHVGLDYYYAIGEGRRSPELVYELARGKEDIEVNVDQLEGIIKLAGM